MLLSSTAIVPKGENLYPGALLGVLVYLICGIIVLVRRHHIEPESTSTPALATTCPTVFDFDRYRSSDLYGRITAHRGAVPPASRTPGDLTQAASRRPTFAGSKKSAGDSVPAATLTKSSMAP
jgi:hypothetical protein